MWTSIILIISIIFKIVTVLQGGMRKKDCNASASRLIEFMHLTASKSTMDIKDPITLASKVNAGDFHAWVETSKGDILNYPNNHPCHQVVRDLNGLTEERVYHAHSP